MNASTGRSGRPALPRITEHPRLTDRIEAARALDARALASLLSDPDPRTTAALAAAADETMRAEVGNAVRFRGLLEFSNGCRADCLYCGSRRSNGAVHRYTLS
ncbi:MAG: hypothetical protein R6W94_03000, partial [Spirochaetia bacterium]